MVDAFLPEHRTRWRHASPTVSACIRVPYAQSIGSFPRRKPSFARCPVASVRGRHPRPGTQDDERFWDKPAGECFRSKPDRVATLFASFRTERSRRRLPKFSPSFSFAFPTEKKNICVRVTGHRAEMFFCPQPAVRRVGASNHRRKLYFRHSRFKRGVKVIYGVMSL